MINAKWMRQSVALPLVMVVMTSSANASVTLQVTEANKVRQETFENLPVAVSAARSLRQKTPTAQLVLMLDEGIYHLDASVYLDATLSGTPQAPTVIKGAPGRWPELRASRIVKTSWSPYDKGYGLPLSQATTSISSGSTASAKSLHDSRIMIQP